MYGGGSGNRKNNTNKSIHQNKHNYIAEDSDDNTKVCKQQFEKGNLIRK